MGCGGYPPAYRMPLRKMSSAKPVGDLRQVMPRWGIVRLLPIPVARLGGTLCLASPCLSLLGEGSSYTSIV